MLSLNPGPWECQTSIPLTELCPRPSCHIFLYLHVISCSSKQFTFWYFFFIQPEIFFTCPQHFLFAFVMKVMCLVLFLEHPVLCAALLAVTAFQSLFVLGSSVQVCRLCGCGRRVQHLKPTVSYVVWEVNSEMALGRWHTETHETVHTCLNT